MEAPSAHGQGVIGCPTSRMHAGDSSRVDLSIVIPVYNEEESLRALVEELQGQLDAMEPSCEIVLIDDGSTDTTWALMKELAAAHPALRAFRFRRNYGQTAAFSAGFDKARGDVIITLDADLQNDPADIPRLLAKLEEGCDVVSGWRKNRQDRFADRRLPSLLANALIRRLTRVPIHDLGCSLKAYRREVIEDVHLYGEMHRFLPALAAMAGGRVGEVVVGHRARKFGTSKYGLSRTVTVILDLITVQFLLRYSTGPIQMFGKWAALFIGPGAVMLALMVGLNGLATVTDLVLPGATLIKRPFWVMTSFMLMFMGLQFLSIGLLAEIQIRTYHESQGKPIYRIREAVDPAGDA